MRIIARRTLREFWLRHPDCEETLKAWFHEAEQVTWRSPGDVKKQFPSASIIEHNRLVFNIKGNRYRVIVKANYPFELLYIRFVGTHAEYDKIDAATI